MFLHVCDLDDSHVLSVFRHIGEWSSSCLDPSHSQSGLVCCCCSENFFVQQEDTNARLVVPDQLPAVRGSFSLSQSQEGPPGEGSV